MWLLSFVPDSFLLIVVNAILLVGVVSSIVAFFGLNLLFRWFPQFSPYYLLIQIVSFGILLAGVYFKGSFSTELEWRNRVHEAEEKAKVAEQQANDANKKINTKVVTKIKKVVEVQEKIKEIIVEKEKIINAECKVVPDAIMIHNAAAKNHTVGETE